MIRVLVAASSAVARAGLEALVRRDPAATVVGAVGAGAALAEEIDARAPDVVLVAADPGAPLDALLARPLSSDADARAPALVLLADASPGEAASAIVAGARAVLPPEASEAEILAAIEGAAAGLVVIRPGLASRLAGAGRTVAAGGPAGPGGPGGIGAPGSATGGGEAAPPALTPRELEVLALLAEGLGNKMIAARLRISEHTVKTHIAAVFAKLHAYTRAEAVAIGVRRGLIML